ncbi:MAG: hypothetical protein K2J90_04110 [Lachnospiraceae bacterium]|nr:hypothetical protein [Lachnospiraceae bacterium]
MGVFFKKLRGRYKRYREHLRWRDISVCSWEMFPAWYYYLYSEQEIERMEREELDKLWQKIDLL